MVLRADIPANETDKWMLVNRLGDLQPDIARQADNHRYVALANKAERFVRDQRTQVVRMSQAISSRIERQSDVVREIRPG